MRLPIGSYCLRVLALALLGLAGPSSAVAGPPPEAAWDRAGWQADYAQLKQALQDGYANLAWFAAAQGGVDLPALDRQTQRALETAENPAQAEQAIRDFVAGFGDGHFSFLGRLAPAAEVAVTPPPRREDLAGLPAPAACAVMTTAAGRVAFSLPLESLPGFRLDRDGLSTAFRSGVWTSRSGVRIGVLRIQEFSARAYPGLCLSQWERLRTLPSPAQREAALEQAWYAQLAQRLRDFAREPVDVLLVDVGDNPGGDDSGDIATRLFSARPLRSAPLLVSQAASGRAYLDEQAGLLKETAGQAGLSRRERRLLQSSLAGLEASRRAIAGPSCDLSWAWRERRDWRALPCRRLVAAGSSGGPLDLPPEDGLHASVAERLNWAHRVRADWGAWSGPVYVLTDGKTYSSAEMFAARLRDNGAARTVGQRTGGDGCGFMVSAPPVQLAHSGLRLRMPNCVRLRADGGDEVAGVAADLPVPPRQGEDARSRALRLLETVAEDGRARLGD